jgi:ribose/xylose/arabinose/galactoside ABC-type transport system permease subunit
MFTVICWCKMKTLKELSLSNKLLVVLVIELLLLSILVGNFFTFSNFMNVFRQSSIIYMLALGQMLVLLVAGIDLSQGSIVGMVSVFSVVALKDFGVMAGILTGLLTGTAIGFINGFFVGKARVQPFITTLGTMYIINGITLSLTNGQPIFNIPLEYSKVFFYLGGGYILNIPIPFIIAILATIGMGVVLYLFPFGRHIYAVGDNEEAARLCGINIFKIKFIIYGLSGFFTSIGALMLTARVNSGEPLLGEGLLFESIGAVVVGGTSLMGGVGSIRGTILGVLIIGFLVNGLDMMNLSTFIKDIIIGMIIIFAVYSAIQKKRHK